MTFIWGKVKKSKLKLHFYFCVLSKTQFRQGVFCTDIWPAKTLKLGFTQIFLCDVVQTNTSCISVWGKNKLHPLHLVIKFLQLCETIMPFFTAKNFFPILWRSQSFTSLQCRLPKDIDCVTLIAESTMFLFEQLTSGHWCWQLEGKGHVCSRTFPPHFSILIFQLTVCLCAGLYQVSHVTSEGGWEPPMWSLDVKSLSAGAQRHRVCVCVSEVSKKTAQ